MKKILSSIMLLAGLVAFSGCEKYLDVNKNNDAPDQVEAYLLLAGIESAYQGFYWDIRALGPLTQMMGTTGYTNFANNYYTVSSDAGGEMWRMSYWLQGMNLEDMINKSLDQEMYTLAGMGMAMKAFSWDCITKYHGEAPMKQAYEPGRLSHDYDYQPEIMSQVRAWAEEAIELLEKEDATDYGSLLKNNDIIYHGDKAKWLKFAHSVIVTDLAALTNKKDFSEKYAQELLKHAALAIDTNDANFTLERGGGGADAQYSAYNNFWGTFRGNLSYSYFQSDYIVELMTGTVPKYDHSSTDRIDQLDEEGNPKSSGAYLWELNEKQIICDTTKALGHYDPRVAAKLATTDGKTYEFVNDADAIKAYQYVGSGRTSASSPTGASVPNLFGWRKAVSNTDLEGEGRWIFRDSAPYIMLTAAEIQFEVAETYWKLGQKAQALAAFKKGVALDVEFTGSYINAGAPNADKTDGGSLPGGCMISKSVFNTLAAEYIAGPYVDGLSESEFTLSHIMMQKYVALWPWGALEAWTDLRKYHYDIDYTGDYPKLGNGWTKTEVSHKWDEDPTKVYKGFYLAPSQVEFRKSSFNNLNEGSPCYRVRPRYNSEYMWNKISLDALKPISGLADNYHCSMPWFAYPGDMPESL
ncbi:MAG: SusD/RagB family nutrient-binding outer membrane lipoprotein [Bacteroidales bacterium]|nr:SusD/RagB family nutrient-binding outer membrane lipoprotein [Bacteroidales bacterium]